MHAAQGPAWALALEHSAFGEAMRGGIYLYPVVETAHILGFATLVGAILVLDFRLIGLGARIPAAALARLAGPVAAVGLMLAVSTGALLFVTEATAYVRNPFFLAKLGLILAGLANIAAFYKFAAPALRALPSGAALPFRVRLSGALSAAIWIAAPICGRLIAYV